MEKENNHINDTASDKLSDYSLRNEDIVVPDDAFAMKESESDVPVDSELLLDSLADDDIFLDDNEAVLKEDDSFLQTMDDPSYIENDKTSEIQKEAILEPTDVKSTNIQKRDNGRNKVESAFDFLEMFVFALSFVLIAMAFLFRHSVVDGPSMQNTLYDGEHLLISDLFYTPKNGDIVVVQDKTKSGTLSHPIVKRVIATEGQTVMIRYNGEIYVDGELLDEKYVYISINEPYIYEEMTVTVPEDSVFLLGDHRNNSSDSRKAGCFKEDAILGKVILRFLPLNRFGSVK